MGFQLQHLAASLSSLEDQSISAAFDLSPPRVVSLHDRTPRGQVITRYVTSAIHNFPSSTGATVLTPRFSKFRMGVVARDGTCLVTDVMHSYCTSCHIVPLSRPDVKVRPVHRGGIHASFLVSLYADIAHSS